MDFIEKFFARGLRKFQTPCYVIDLDQAKKNLQSIKKTWRSHFGNVSIAYSMKTNRHEGLLRILKKLGEGVDVVSGKELSLALAAGIPPAKIFFNGPYKNRADLRLALRHGVNIQVDALEELKAILALSAGKKLPPLSLRISHPLNDDDFSRFGFGEAAFAEAQALLLQKGIPLSGLHFHFGKNAIAAAGLPAMANFMAAWVARLDADTRKQLKWLDVGGGFSSLKEHERLAKLLPPKLRAAGAGKLKIVVEPGRSAVENAGYIVSSVVSVKKGPVYTITLDASKTMMPSHKPQLEMLFIHPENAAAPVIKANIYGSNCFEKDIFVPAIRLPLQTSHLIFKNAGAYDFATGHLWTRDRPFTYIIKDKKLARSSY